MEFILILRGIGIAMLLGGLAMFRIHRQRRAQWTATTGRVIEMLRSNTGHKPSRALRPVVEFTSAAKQRIRFDGAVASWPPRYKVGDRAKVLYNPQQPEQAIVDDSDSSWIAPAILSGMGSIITLLTFAEVGTR